MDENTINWFFSIQGILTIAGILLAVIGIILTFKFRRKRILKYYIPTRGIVFSNNLVDLENFNLVLNDKPVRDLIAVTLIIKNIGNETLYEKDFLKPLRIVFNKEVNLFPFKILRKNKDIPVTYDYGVEDGQSVFNINTKFIEPGDSLILKFLYESDSGAEIKLDTRIINGKIIYQYKFSYEESSRDTHRKLITGRYKEPMRSISFFLMLIIFFISKEVIQDKFSNYYPNQSDSFIYEFLFYTILFTISSGLSMLIVFTFFKEIVDKESKKTQELLVKRKEKYNDENS